MRPFFTALQFLTVLPVPARWAGHSPTALPRSIPFFPAVGLLAGAAVAAMDAVLTRLMPLWPASVLLVIAMVAVSGGLHLDGLSDTADGLFSARPRERMLEIMKDSHCGPMGVAAVVCVLALKIASVQAIPTAVRRPTLLLMPLAGRCALVVTMALLGYARTEGGTGAAFAGRKPRGAALLALVGLAGVGWWTCNWLGLAAATASVCVGALIAWYTWRKLRGWTGDTLGATCEVVELVPALVAGCWIRTSA